MLSCEEGPQNISLIGWNISYCAKGILTDLCDDAFRQMIGCDCMCLQEAHSEFREKPFKCKHGSGHILIYGCGGTAHRASPVTIIHSRWTAELISFEGCRGALLVLVKMYGELIWILQFACSTFMA